MISDEYFFQLSQSLLDRTEQLTLSILEEIRATAITLSNGNIVNLGQEQQRLLTMWADWEEDARKWVDENLPKAYKKGISIVDSDFPDEEIIAGSFASIGFFGSSGGGNIPPSVRQALGDLDPKYLTMYEVFAEQAYEGFQSTRVPVVRSSVDTIRDLSVVASDEAYLNADTLTRRQLSQDIMNKLANEGITGVRYSNGRTVQLDSYAEMVARTQTGNASRQAAINRTQEYNQDLVLISEHYPVSPLCEPWHGAVYSISGSSNIYPSLDSAISGGLFHSNCKHSMSSFTHGQKIPDAREEVSKPENRKRYEAQQRQRTIERRIKSWKRRKAAALTDDEAQRAQSFISKWQKEQRSHLDDNSFLRRAYGREQI